MTTATREGMEVAWWELGVGAGLLAAFVGYSLVMHVVVDMAERRLEEATLDGWRPSSVE